MSTDSMSTALRFAVLISARVSADSGVAMQLQQRQTFFFLQNWNWNGSKSGNLTFGFLKEAENPSNECG